MGNLDVAITPVSVIGSVLHVSAYLTAITEALESYEARAKADARVGVNVGGNVGVNDVVLALLRVEPTLSASAIADRLGKASRTIERHLADLKAAGRVRREGSAKAGRWVVIDS